MLPFKCIVVDDDVQACNALVADINFYCKNIQIIDTAHSVADAVSKINHHAPNLVFLDIQLGDGSGFDVLEKTEFKQFKTVFVTAYNEYAIKAFKVKALDYLLKPVNESELKMLSETLLDSIHFSKNIPLQKIDSKDILPHRISFNTADGISIHLTSSIIYCEANRNYTTIYFVNGEKLLTAKALGDLEKILSHHGFERIHQSYIINLIHLKKYMNKDGGVVIMSDGTNLSVSRRKKSDLLQILNNISS